MFNMLLAASQSISAPIRHSRYCANDMMLYAESAILDQNLHHLYYPQLMGQDGKVEPWEEQHVNLHFRLADCRIEIFRYPEWDQVVQVAIQDEMASDLVVTGVLNPNNQYNIY
jgi:hypothetical protein